MNSRRLLIYGLILTIPLLGEAQDLGTQSAEAIYARIKAKYISSENCHRYSQMPQDYQKAFKIKLYRNEIEAFRSTNPSEMTPAMALNSIANDFGMDDATETKLSEDWYSTIATAPPATEGKEVFFQSELIEKMKEQLNADNENQAAVQKRVDKLLSDSGILEDCDFISEDAFVAAYQAKVNFRQDLNKPDLLTIIDRSLPKTGRRVITIDLKEELVLFHSIAGFGDADGTPRLQSEEGDVCSNVSNSSATPYGMAFSVGMSRAAIDRINGFSGLGTMLSTQKGSSPANGFKERGIAIHSGGYDLFSGYGIDDNHTQTMGELLQGATSMGASEENVDDFLWRTIASPLMTAVTNGCVALPSDELPIIQEIVENGSAIYFYCPPEMIK